MEPTFRQSMNWLHTWTGLVVSALLFAIFWMGTLSVFDREIDRWMMPATRLPAPAAPVRLDADVRPVAERLAAGSPFWFVALPTERAPTAQIRYREASGEFATRHLDPATGAQIPDPGTLAGTGFVFPFHFHLHLNGPWRVGYWLVAAIGTALVLMIATGVVVHKRIFADFFTLRVGRSQRTALDLHNATGVLALPFHLVIAISGVVVFFSLVVPTPWQTVYGGDRARLNREFYGSFERPKAGRPAPLGSLDAMRDEAERRWGAPADFVRVTNAGDAAAVVSFRRTAEDVVSYNPDFIDFDGVTGAVLNVPDRPWMTRVHLVVEGLHFVLFKHWTLRWVYFALGLAGCVLIATGLMFWVESRRKRHERLGLGGLRFVEGMTVGSVTGVVAATLAFLVANRLLPQGLPGRAGMEFWTFYAAWAAAFAHAWLRPARPAWREQCWLVAGLAALAVVLNGATTGDHLARALAHRHLWGVAGMDLLLLLGAVVAAAAARALAPIRPDRAVVGAHDRSARSTPAE